MTILVKMSPREGPQCGGSEVASEGEGVGPGRESFPGAGLSVILVRDAEGPPCHHVREVRIGFCAACRPPRDWLHRLQTVRVLSRVSSPP